MLSPDVLEVLTIKAGNIAKNLYLYCNNNPVSRQDDEGKFWHCIVAGAVSAVLEMGITVISNKLTGAEWNEGVLSAGLSGFASGALGVCGAKYIGTIAGQAIGQGVIAVASEGYELWNKREEGITAWDVIASSYNVMDAISGGWSYDISEVKNLVKGSKAFTNSLKKCKNWRQVKQSLLKDSSKNLVKKSVVSSLPNLDDWEWRAIDTMMNVGIYGLNQMATSTPVFPEQPPKRVFIGNHYYMKW